MTDKLEAFRALLEAQTRQRYADEQKRDHARGMDYPLSVHEQQSVCTIKVGRKYVNVDVGTSGKYMVVIDTGEIFGIKGYGVIHRGHAFGTLDTISDWDWSGYRAVRKAKQAA